MNKTKSDWHSNPRWRGIERTYSLGDVQRLQGSVVPEHTLARRGAEKLWDLLQTEPFVPHRMSTPSSVPPVGTGEIVKICVAPAGVAAATSFVNVAPQVRGADMMVLPPGAQSPV